MSGKSVPRFQFAHSLNFTFGFETVEFPSGGDLALADSCGGTVSSGESVSFPDGGMPFGGNPDMEVDFISERNKLAIEIDGSHHFADKDAYRRDRRKDELLQENGYFILRFLADDVMNNLGEVMTRVVRRLK